MLLGSQMRTAMAMNRLKAPTLTNMMRQPWKDDVFEPCCAANETSPPTLFDNVSWRTPRRHLALTFDPVPAHNTILPSAGMPAALCTIGS